MRVVHNSQSRSKGLMRPLDPEVLGHVIPSSLPTGGSVCMFLVHKVVWQCDSSSLFVCHALSRHCMSWYIVFLLL